MRLCPLRLCRQLLPWWQQAADLALRQLEQQRGEWLVNRRQVRACDERSRIAHQPRAQAVQRVVRTLLVEIEMAGRVKGDRSGAAPLAPEAQRDLLCHSAAWHEDRRRLAQHPGDLVLEVLDQLARAVDVALSLGACLRRQRRQLVTHREAPVAGERAASARTAPCGPFPRAAAPRAAPARTGSCRLPWLLSPSLYLIILLRARRASHDTLSGHAVSAVGRQ